MSANNQTLIKEYKGKWYVFTNIQAESWCEIDDNDRIIEGRDNELLLKRAIAVCDSREEALDKAFELDKGEGEYGEGTEYGVAEFLVKDGADIKIIE